MTKRQKHDQLKKELELKYDVRVRNVVHFNHSWFCKGRLLSAEWEKLVRKYVTLFLAEHKAAGDTMFSIEGWDSRTWPDIVKRIKNEARTEDDVKAEFYAQHVNKKIGFELCYEYAAALDTLRVLGLEAKVEELNEMCKKKEHKDNAENA